MLGATVCHREGTWTPVHWERSHVGQWPGQRDICRDVCRDMPLSCLALWVTARGLIKLRQVDEAVYCAADFCPPVAEGLLHGRDVYVEQDTPGTHTSQD